MSILVFAPPSKKVLFFVGFIFFSYTKELLQDIKIDILFSDRRAEYFELNIFYTIGDLLSGFFELIIKKRINNKDVGQKPFHVKIPSGKIDLTTISPLIFTNKKKSLIPFKRVLFLSIYDFLSHSCSIIYVFIYYEEAFKLPYHDKNLSLIFDIISRFILNKIILKGELYPHHYLSIMINIFSFFVLSISELYFIIPNISSYQIIYILKTIIKIILYSFENVEGKIGLNSEFLNPFNLLFYKGIAQSIILIIISIFSLIFKKYYLFTGLFDNKNYNFNITTLLIVILFIIINMLSNICIWKIIDLYSIQHLTIAKGGSFFISYISTLIRKKLQYQEKGIYLFYFTDLFGYFLLFIGTLIYNEIIIFNCYNLSTFTYKELKEREEDDLNSRNDSINSYCSIENNTQKSDKTLSSKGTQKSRNNQNFKCENNNSILDDSIDF